MKNLKNIFIGRTNEIGEFNDFISPQCSERILNIHSKGDGGIGKTVLLNKLLSLCQNSKSLLAPKNFVDFYNTETNVRLGIMRTIADGFSNYGFNNFIIKLGQHGDSKLKPEDRKDYEARMEEWFLNELFLLVEYCRNNNKILLLAFDNYEKIQRENIIIKQWFEQLIHYLLNISDRLRVIIVGRDKILLNGFVKYIHLKGFSYDEMVSYLKECYTQDKIDYFIGNQQYLKCLYRLIEARPILLSLVVNWFEYGNNFNLRELFLNDIKLNPNNLSENIECEITELQLDEFKRKLISHIDKLGEPKDRILTYMAFAWRRMTCDLFSFISGYHRKDRISKLFVKDLINSGLDEAANFIEKMILSQDDNNYYFKDLHSIIQNLIENVEPSLDKFSNNFEIGSETIFSKWIEPLSFVKKIEGQEPYYVLHDEMKVLIEKYWWDEQPLEIKTDRKKEIAQKIVDYYSKEINQKSISSTMSSNLYGERLHYAFQIDVDSALKHYFFPDFDFNLKLFHINTCGLLLSEIDKVAEGKFNFNIYDKIRILITKIQWLNERYQSDLVLELCKKKIEDSKEIMNALQIYPDLYAKYKHERGIAHMWLNNNKAASEDFLEAEKFFKNQNLLLSSSWSKNCRGYSIYRDGDFKNAEYIWAKTISELLKIKREDFFQTLTFLYGNLNASLTFQGRFYEASIHGQIALFISRELRNEREIIRGLISLGHTYQHSNRPFQSFKCYNEALTILETLPARDVLLEARACMGKGTLLYRQCDYIYIIEYYMRGSDLEKAMEIFKDKLPESQKRYKEAKEHLDRAHNLLEKSYTVPMTIETAMLNIYFAEYYSIDSNWDKSLEFYSKSQDISFQILNKYSELNSILGQVIIYYLKGDYLNFDKSVRNIAKRLEKTEFWNIRGTLEIIRGNYEYEKYMNYDDNRLLRMAVERYIVAADYMMKFGRISQDRFFMTLQIIVKRLSDIPFEKLPDANELELFKDIWNYEQNDRSVCQKYGELFDDIINYCIMRKKCCQNNEQRRNYLKQIQEKISTCLNAGKIEFRFLPIWAMMNLQIHLDSGSSEEKAQAQCDMANAYAINDIMFEAYNHYEYALRLINEKQELANSYLHAKILIQYGTIIYRRGQYAINIENYRKNIVRKNSELFLIEYKNNIERSEKYFNQAESMLKSLDQDAKETAYEKANLYFRWAELYIMIGKSMKIIENCLKESTKQAKEGDNLWVEIDAMQSLITLYYISEQFEKKYHEINELEDNIIYLNQKKRHSPLLLAFLEITKGNAIYDKIENESFNEDIIEEAFNHYIKSTRLKAAHSIKHFFQSMNNLLDRISELPDDSLRLLYKNIYPRLIQKKPTGSVMEDMFKLVEQYIQTRYLIQEKK